MIRRKLTKRIAAAALTVGILGAMTGYVYSANAAEGGTEKTEETKDTEASAGGEILEDKFGAVVFYRWKRIYSGQEPPKTKEAYPLMAIRKNCYIAPRLDRFYFSTLRKGWNGKKYTNEARERFAGLHSGEHPRSESSPIGIPDRGKYNVELETADVCEQQWRACFLNQGRDPQVKVDRDTFFTDDDRGVIYCRWVMDMIRGQDGAILPHYSLFKENPNLKDTYYFTVGTENAMLDYPYCNNNDYNYEGYDIPSALWPSYDSNQWKVNRSTLHIERKSDGWTEDETRLWVCDIGSNIFKFCNSSIQYCIDINEYGQLYSRYVYYAQPTNGYSDPANAGWKLFKGEKVHFSSLKGSTKIQKNQILSVSPADYVDADGNTTKSKGAFVPNGATLTIEKGGLLAVTGNFINNGTIINNGGTILIKKGGSISPFMVGTDIAKNGCGTLKCNGGDIIIEDGGAIYTGMNDDNGNQVPFTLDNSSTLINDGLLVYGQMRMTNGSRLECRSGSRTIGNVYTYRSKYQPGWSEGRYHYLEIFNYSTNQWDIFVPDQNKILNPNGLSYNGNYLDQYAKDVINSNSDYKSAFSLWGYDPEWKTGNLRAQAEGVVSTGVDTDYDLLSEFTNKVMKEGIGKADGLYRARKSDPDGNPKWNGGLVIEGTAKGCSIIMYPGTEIDDWQMKGKSLDKYIVNRENSL